MQRRKEFAVYYLTATIALTPTVIFIKIFYLYCMVILYPISPLVKATSGFICAIEFSTTLL